jgi:2-dehydro-3-deoxyphosphogluconate aldolase / (4S)-4-hydroxy-2-oxoglutarate aldolase
MSTLPRFSPLLGAARVIPVLTIEDAAEAVPLARALAAGGISVIEVTLRTKAALKACEAIAHHCPDVVLGIGTVLAPSQIAEARDAGAKFLVTPGTSATLARAVAESGIAALPGAATVSEMLALMEMGFHELKFFPAEAAGGVDYLKSVAGPLADLRFCPTGGIGPANAGTYLGLGNVLCVGGSWITPKAAMASGNWSEITRLATEAAKLGR